MHRRCRLMSVGAEGVISVASNIIPRQLSRMVNSYATGKTAAALKLHQQYYPMFRDLFIETNPRAGSRPPSRCRASARKNIVCHFAKCRRTTENAWPRR